MISATTSYYYEELTRSVTYPWHVVTTTSPRKVLIALNLIITFCGIYISMYGAYVTQLLYDPQNFTMWFSWGILVVVGICLTVLGIVGMRGAHLVSLELLLTYFWGIAVLISPLGSAIFAVFNISFYTKIWIKHVWDTQSFLNFRKLFCEAGTAHTKCVAPLDDSLTDQSNNATYSFCFENYGSYDCSEIRNSAIRKCVQWGTSLILANSIIGLGCLVIMAVCIYITIEILTHPVITQSMLDIINYLLLLPIGACIWQAIAFWSIQELQGNGITLTWLPKLYVVLACAQLVALPLGIVSGRYKSRPLLIIYITFSILIIAGLVLAGVLGWTLAKLFAENYHPSDDEIGRLACDKHLPLCSGCQDNPPTCTEWSGNEVMTLYSLDFRFSGMVSLLALLYILGAVIVAFIVENSLKNYKSDFV